MTRAPSPWTNPPEHRERRGARPARRSRGRMAARSRRRAAWLLPTVILASLGVVPQPASGQDGIVPDLPVRELTLDNGLRLLILPRPSAPTVAFVVEYAVGGVNETLGSTGTAHLLEHMLFKGTTTVGTRDVEAELDLFARMDAAHDSLLAESSTPAPDTARLGALRERVATYEGQAQTPVVSNEFSRILTRNGARNLNATTSSEATTYFVELPANRAKLWFLLESDRARNPVSREFYTERDVVMEERRTRVDTNPGGLLHEVHLATAFLMHPYGVPVVGYMSDLERLSRRDVEEYHQRYYGARNAVVAIVGDVVPDSIAAWARDYLGGIRPGAPPPPVLAVEPPQRGERRVELVMDAEPQLRVGWHTVSGHHPDSPALTMLASVLSGRRTSRLYRRLVTQDRLAAAVTASTVPGSRFAGQFVIHVTPRAPGTPAEIEAALYEEIERLALEPPEQRELQRVRNQLVASGVRRLQSNLGLALQLAGSVTRFGNWQTTFERTALLYDVQPADVQRVVQTYFTRDNRTVATLVKRTGDTDP